eukprot:XP_015571952.1 uncharacterized protein LOC8284437 isoform X2 [Ricinus communis]
MPVLLLTVPKIWICEVCQSSEEKDSQQSFTGAHFPRILTPLNSEIVYSDTVKSIAVEFLENSGSLLNFQNETAIGTGKLNFICSEEVIEQPSGVLKVENFSPSIQGSIFGQSTAIMVSSRTDIGFKIPPSKFSKQIVKASPSIRIQERSLLPGQDGAESSLKTKRQVCKIKDKGTALAYQDKYALKKEPVDLLLPAKRVESPNSTLRKATKFTHSPSMNFQTITHSGKEVSLDAAYMLMSTSRAWAFRIMIYLIPCPNLRNILYITLPQKSLGVEALRFLMQFRIVNSLTVFGLMFLVECIVKLLNSRNRCLEYCHVQCFHLLVWKFISMGTQMGMIVYYTFSLSTLRGLHSSMSASW